MTYYNRHVDFDDIDNKELLSIVLKNDLYVTYAGMIAEKLFYKKISGSNKFPAHLKIGSEQDVKEGYSAIKKYKLSNDTKKYKNKLMKLTEKVIETYWEDLVKIAHLLYNKRKIKSNDLEKVLKSTFWKSIFKDIKKIKKIRTEEVYLELIKKA